MKRHTRRAKTPRQSPNRDSSHRGKYALVIIGAGPAGLMAAHRAAARNLKVALIERNLLGGECLNTGCIPSKAIIRTARLFAEMRNAENFGARVPTGITVDFPFLMERMKRVRARISRQSFSPQQLTSQGVDIYRGQAVFDGPTSVAVDGRSIH